MIPHFLLNKMYWSRMQLSAALLPVSGFMGLRRAGEGQGRGGGRQWVDNDSRRVGGDLSALSPQIPVLPKRGCIMVIKATLPGAGPYICFPGVLWENPLTIFFFLNFNVLRHVDS